MRKEQIALTIDSEHPGSKDSITASFPGSNLLGIFSGSVLTEYADFLQKLKSVEFIPESELESRKQEGAKGVVADMLENKVAVRRTQAILERIFTELMLTYTAWVREQIKKGWLTEAEVKQHPIFSIISPVFEPVKVKDQIKPPQPKRSRSRQAPSRKSGKEDRISRSGQKIVEYLLTNGNATLIELATKLDVHVLTVARNMPYVTAWFAANGFELKKTLPVNKFIKGSSTRYSLIKKAEKASPASDTELLESDSVGVKKN